MILGVPILKHFSYTLTGHHYLQVKLHNPATFELLPLKGAEVTDHACIIRTRKVVSKQSHGSQVGQGCLTQG